MWPSGVTPTTRPAVCQTFRTCRRSFSTRTLPSTPRRSPRRTRRPPPTTSQLPHPPPLHTEPPRALQGSLWSLCARTLCVNATLGATRLIAVFTVHTSASMMMESNTALWRATMARRYSRSSMRRLGAAVVLRSACTPAAVTLLQKRRLRASWLRAVSAVQLRSLIVRPRRHRVAAAEVERLERGAAAHHCSPYEHAARAGCKRSHTEPLLCVPRLPGNASPTGNRMHHGQVAGCGAHAAQRH
jgi:hypothetical protein